MSDRERGIFDSERRMPLAPMNVTTWRYLGDRTAADLAYCVRFEVQQAPEPAEAPSGVLSYPLPTAVPGT